MTRARAPKPLLAAALVIASLSPFATGCSLGQGQGAVHSDQLNVNDCWCNSYDLQPDFFAAVPFRDTLQIRVQRGTDLQEVSDGIAILVDDVKAIIPTEEEKAKDPPETRLLNKKLKISLPDSIELTGMSSQGSEGTTLQEGCGPSKAEICPKEDPHCLDPLSTDEPVVDGTPLIHMALYLQQSCHNQNSVLYAVSGTIIFKKLFNGLPNEKEAANKYTEALFQAQMVSLQDVPTGTDPTTLPPEKVTNIQGWFQFYFERGQPGQPFP